MMIAFLSIAQKMRCRLLFVMCITKNNLSKRLSIQEVIMKLLNKIIAFFSTMNVTFGTFNN